MHTTDGETHQVTHVEVNDSTLVVAGAQTSPTTIKFNEIDSIEKVSRKSVVYAEAALEYGVNHGIEQQNFPSWYGIAELGYLSGELVRPRPKWGFGGTVLLGAAESNFRMAFKARARYRVNPTLSLDVAAGPRLDPSKPEFNGFMGSVGVNVGSVFTLRSELMSYEIDPWTTIENGITPIEHPGGDVYAWYNGIALRGVPGWTALGIGAAAFVALTILVVASGGAE